MTRTLRDDEIAVMDAKRLADHGGMRRSIPLVTAIAEVLAMAAVMRAPHQEGPGRYRLRLDRVLRPSKTYKPNGARECARRARQVAAGSLTAANGLR